MMRTQNWLVAAGVGAALCLSASNGLAQNNGGGGGGGGGRGGRQRNFDPAQRQQQMMEGIKARLEVNNDDEWNALQPMIQKVMDARRDSFAGMGRGMWTWAGRSGRSRRGRRPRRGRRQRHAGGRGGEPSPEAEALRKAIDAKASTGEIKAALTRYVESRKAKAEQLKTAQENLRKVLTARQEAIATLDGLL